MATVRSLHFLLAGASPGVGCHRKVIAMGDHSPRPREQPHRPREEGFWKTGPAWLGAVAALVTALTGLGIAAGILAAGRGHPDTASTAGTPASRSATSSPAAGLSQGILPSRSPSPGDLIVHCNSVTIKSGYGVTPGKACPPEQEAGSGELRYLANQISAGPGAQLTLPDAATGNPSLRRSCETATSPAGIINTRNLSAGNSFCFKDHSVIAAVKIMRVKASPDYVELDVHVWQSSR